VNPFLTLVWQTLRESMSRRMGRVLIMLAVLSPLFFLWKLRVTTQPDGTILAAIGDGPQLAAANFTNTMLDSLASMSNMLWMFLGLFAASSLITSYLEKGWAEVIFSKGLSRGQILLARFTGSLALFAGTLFVLAGAPALYIGWRTGVPVGRYFVTLAIVVFSFACILALMSISALGQPVAAVPVMVGFLVLTLAPSLALRADLFYRYYDPPWFRLVVDWLYRLLPKITELQRASLGYWRRGEIADWWPFWSSGLFLVLMLALAILILNRKNL
jgi:ABC-type transport system involved in multi-copper enzyme maturation permease subunit